MAKLSAKFKITPTYPLITECREGEHFSYTFFDDNYEILINLLFMEGGPKNGLVNCDLYKQLVNRVEIVVTKEVKNIPELPLTERGGPDKITIEPYFSSQKEEYARLAETYYKRLIRYFKYELKQPFHDDEHLDRTQFSNPAWSGSNGVEYGTIGYLIIAKEIHGMDKNTLDVESLKLSHIDTIGTYLQSETDIELFQEIMSDAQAAVFGGDLRRAVFEMAVVCELSTKRKYFSEGGVSGLAFDYFEDKGKVKVTVLELLSTVAKEVLDESYKEHSPAEYTNIDYLFRCRNKVAHRGDVIFKDDSGTLIRPDIELVEKWYESVCNLLRWLSSK